MAENQKHGPDGPSELRKPDWKGVLKRTFKQFQSDNLGDWAAALTYYAILSLFPGLLALTSALGFLGKSATHTVISTLESFVPATAKPIVGPAIAHLHSGGASIAAVVGILGALWSASAYIGAFMRASNAIYDVPEGRPFWKTLPLRVGLTIMIGVLLVVSAVIVVFTGRLATVVGNALHVGQTAVTVWSIVKWPVLLVLVSLAFALLYYLAPNARQTGFRWITPGGLLAVVIWVVASGLFGLYAANFSSYNKTYGTLGGVIAALVWLWISNIAILLGAEFDAELERARAIQGGLRPEDQEPYLPLRDDRKVDPNAEPKENKGLT
ncbi:YihY/virulence factor BrkB family protein [Planosporangium thailandense]|uniref:YihY/virulence factor BrkB family protein n=1 Tax=Planosporangium thailandense TaxID=765197 RepID=A0ABX0Y844_9ACTN|nr:YihY/virulence factor BrkB family protein [Planosporangium thailandense]NJC73705.1 YihY/virulence factor BrkB family protein [Planosporangium thailandense]